MAKKETPPAVEPEPIPEVEHFQCECGEPRALHFTALTSIAESPFNPTKTTFVLLCPRSTFRRKQ
jgi:hypothetical protein